MSQGSSNPASPSRPALASDPQETVTPVSHVFGLSVNGCHHEAAHQGQSHSLSLMQERFWWPGMARDLRNCIRKCGRCKKFEATPPVTPLRPLACSRLGELLHMDFTSIEETVPLHEEPVIRNIMVMQDHFSKYVVTYVAYICNIWHQYKVQMSYKVNVI